MNEKSLNLKEDKPKIEKDVLKYKKEIQRISRERYSPTGFLESLSKETGIPTKDLEGPKTDTLVLRLRHARFQSDPDVLQAALDADDPELYRKTYCDVFDKENRNFTTAKGVTSFYNMSVPRAKYLLQDILEEHGIDPETLEREEEDDDEEDEVDDNLVYLFSKKNQRVNEKKHPQQRKDDSFDREAA